MSSPVPARRLNGISAPPGTILGPNTTNEYLVVRSVDDAGVVVGYATVKDIDAAYGAIAADGPRSMTELAMSRAPRIVGAS